MTISPFVILLQLSLERNIVVAEYFLEITEVTVRHTVIILCRRCLWGSGLLRWCGIIVIIIVLGSAVAVILITAAIAALIAAVSA